MSNVIIVNEKDEVIGAKSRDDKSKTDITRVSGLIVVNSNNETLIAQRSFNKINSPGKWGPAVAGTLEEGEIYISNIIKESKEEIDLSITEEDLKEESHTYRETSHRFFYMMFSAIVDKPISEFIIQKEEVEEIRWVKIDDLIEWFNKTPEDFISTFESIIDVLKQKIS